MSKEQFEEFEELGRRAVACKMWRWMPGMLYNHPKDRPSLALRPEGPDAPIIKCGPGGGLPIFSDPATLGCLLALVREAWGKPHAYVEFSDKWKVAFYCDVGTHAFSSTTEAGALIAALEAAP